MASADRLTPPPPAVVQRCDGMDGLGPSIYLIDGCMHAWMDGVPSYTTCEGAVDHAGPHVRHDSRFTARPSSPPGTYSISSSSRCSELLAVGPCQWHYRHRGGVDNMPSDNNATYNAATPPACVSSVSSQLLTATQREMKALKAAWTSSEPHPIPALTPRPYSHADRNRQQPDHPQQCDMLRCYCLHYWISSKVPYN
mmetsp:Transcript_8173/g.11478  ORF Transcript_8173/g.11478 Transcript_8173/m.11478 type:complete len:197 (+) Transcript_8173:1387-1977(+)